METARYGTHDGFLMIGDAARLLGLSTSRVRQLVEQGKIATLRTPSGVRPFVRNDVEMLFRLRAAGISGSSHHARESRVDD